METNSTPELSYEFSRPSVSFVLVLLIAIIVFQCNCIDKYNVLGVDPEPQLGYFFASWVCCVGAICTVLLGKITRCTMYCRVDCLDVAFVVMLVSMIIMASVASYGYSEDCETLTTTALARADYKISEYYDGLDVSGRIA